MSVCFNAVQRPICLVLGTILLAPAAHAQSRGELLYSAHCVTCHTAQMHWRDNRVATDWSSLKAQVQRWQGNAGLAWNNADVVDVTRYLNSSIYKFVQTSDPQAVLAPGGGSRAHVQTGVATTP